MGSQIFLLNFVRKFHRQKEIISWFEGCVDEEQTRRYFEEKNKLEELLVHEEVYWKQRAKSFWLMEGDSNTKFFHTYATARKKCNKISKLINEDGEAVTDQAGMAEVVRNYFVNLFSQSEVDQDEDSLGEGNVISADQNDKLVADLTFEEFQMLLSKWIRTRMQVQMGLIQPFNRIFGV